MRSLILTRHLVDGYASVFELFRRLTDLRSFRNICKDNQWPVTVGCILVIDSGKLSADLISAINGLDPILTNDFGYVKFEEKIGSGRTLIEALMELPQKNRKVRQDFDVLMCLDLDQFIFDNKTSIEKITQLATQLVQSRSLLAVGQRSGEIKLGTAELASKYREVLELICAFAANIKPVDASFMSHNPYHDFGDVTSGCYAINVKHRSYDKFVRSITSQMHSASIKGFAAEFLLVLEASRIAPIAKVMVDNRPNPFFESQNLSQNLVVVRQQIADTVSDLAKTQAQDLLLIALGNQQYKGLLCRYYAQSLVDDVYNICLGSLGQETQNAG